MRDAWDRLEIVLPPASSVSSGGRPSSRSAPHREANPLKGDAQSARHRERCPLVYFQDRAPASFLLLSRPCPSRCRQLIERGHATPVALNRINIALTKLVIYVLLIFSFFEMATRHCPMSVQKKKRKRRKPNITYVVRARTCTFPFPLLCREIAMQETFPNVAITNLKINLLLHSLTELAFPTCLSTDSSSAIS